MVCYNTVTHFDAHFHYCLMTFAFVLWLLPLVQHFWATVTKPCHLATGKGKLQAAEMSICLHFKTLILLFESITEKKNEK